MRMKNRTYLLALLLVAGAMCFPNILFSQQKPSLPHVSPDAPPWMHLLTGDNPNVFEVQKAYTEYFENQVFEKNSYTQYFKHWMHWARPFVQADGFIKEPSADDLAEKEAALRAAREISQQQRNGGAWSFLGPKQPTIPMGSPR